LVANFVLKLGWRCWKIMDPLFACYDPCPISTRVVPIELRRGAAMELDHKVPEGLMISEYIR
jgi:hypothetical protein